MKKNRNPMLPTRAREAKNVLGALHAAHWAIAPEALERMLLIAERRGNVIEALEARLGKPMNEDAQLTERDGVATIDVSGPLFRYANIFTQISGATAYALLATDLRQALDDPQIKAIVLSIDSPGGEVNGAGEFADMVFNARGSKPILAYISGDGCSAAYWIASAADEIVVAPSAIVGCIGTVATLYDTSRADEARGIRRIEVVSSQTPKKRLSPTSDAGQAAVQELVDNLSEIFIAALARNRDVSAETVTAEYGQGGVFVGKAAVASGLADRLGSYEAVVSALATGYKPNRAAARRPNTTSQESHMKVEPAAAATTTELPAAPTLGVAAADGAACECGHAQSDHADGSGACSGESCNCEKYSAKPADASASPNPAAAEAPAQPDAASAPPATAAADAPTSEALRDRAVVAERERILAIEALGRPGEEAIIAECKRDPKCTPEMAALRLRQADSSTRSSRLQLLQGDDKKLESPGPVAPEATDQTSAGAVARRIIAVHEKVTTPNRS